MTYSVMFDYKIYNMGNVDRCLKNLGPRSWLMLEAAGIPSAHQLRKVGSVAAYVEVKKAGQKPSLNLLWALEGALTDRDWKQVAKDERMCLSYGSWIDSAARRRTCSPS